MTYKLYKTDGTLLSEVPDGNFDKTTTSLSLIGKNVTNFGVEYNENLIKLLENFAAVSPPEQALKGQLWYDTTTGRLNVYDGTSFRNSGGPLVSSVQPNNLISGDLWINSEDNQLYFYDGTDLRLAGPIYTNTQGESGFKIETLLDNLGRSHTIAKLFISNTLLGIFSRTAFTPSEPIDGYSGNIAIGFNASTIVGLKFNVLASQAESLVADGVIKTAGQFVYNDEDGAINGSLAVQSSEGLAIGPTENVTHKIVGSTYTVSNQIPNADISVNVIQGTTNLEAIHIDAVNGRLGFFKSSPSATVDIEGDLKVSGNLTVVGDTVNNVVINATTMQVQDSSLELNIVDGLPKTDEDADGGGIILRSVNSDKTVLYTQDNVNGDRWDLSENVNIPSGKTYKIGNVVVMEEGNLPNSITTASGLVEIQSPLQYLNVDDINVNNNVIKCTATNQDLILQTTGTGNVSVSNTKIVDVDDPTSNQDAATKAYVDRAVYLRSLAFTMDISEFATDTDANEYIAYTLGIIAPVYPDNLTSGIAVRGAEARVHATKVTVANSNITYSPAAGSNYTTISVRNADGTGTETVVKDLSSSQTITAPTATVSVTRINKLFRVLPNGTWAFAGNL